MAYLYPGAHESTMIHHVLCAWSPNVTRFSSGYTTNDYGVIYCPICKKEIRADNDILMAHENKHLANMGIDRRGKSNRPDTLDELAHMQKKAEDHRLSKFRDADEKYLAKHPGQTENEFGVFVDSRQKDQGDSIVEEYDLDKLNELYMSEIV